MAKRGHLQQYLEEPSPVNIRLSNRSPRFSMPKSSRPIIDTILAGPMAPKARGRLSSRTLVVGVQFSLVLNNVRSIDSTITFSESPLLQLSAPHDDALVITLEVGCHLMRCILIDHGSAFNLLYLSTLF